MVPSLPALLLGQDDAKRSDAIQVTDFVTGKRVAKALVFVGTGLLGGETPDRNGLIH